MCSGKKLKIDTTLIRDAIGGVLVVHDTKIGTQLDEDNWIQCNQYTDMRNGMGLTRNGIPAEWVALLRTNSKHKYGYEYVVEPCSQIRSHVFRCMKATVDHFEPMDQPRFPNQLPDSIFLPLPPERRTTTRPRTILAPSQTLRRFEQLKAPRRRFRRSSISRSRPATSIP